MKKSVLDPGQFNTTELSKEEMLASDGGFVIELTLFVFGFCIGIWSRVGRDYHLQE